MEQFCLNIQKDVIQAISVPFSEAPQRLKRELAIRLYEKGLISFGKARELSEMPRWAFHELLGEEGVLRRYDVEELEEDLKTLEALD
jgi:predicted HTH domain antitoxin